MESHFSVCWQFSFKSLKFVIANSKCHGNLQSAEAGLAGLTLGEAALGTLWDETMVKKLPDPLGQILDLCCVKKEDLFMVVRFYCIQWSCYYSTQYSVHVCVKRVQASQS